MSRRFALALGVFMLIALAITGCTGTPMAEVSGSVKFDDKPIEKGVIWFEPTDGKTQPASGEIKDGYYAVSVPIGPTKVKICGYKSMGKIEHMPGSHSEAPGELLPEKYSNIKKTELIYDVKPGPNPKDWELPK